MVETTMTITSDEEGARYADRFMGLRRKELLTLALAAIIANALIYNVFLSIGINGIYYSVLNTFEVSVIIWVAIFIAFKFIWNIPDASITLADRVASALVLLMCLAPLGPLTWVSASIFGAYLICTARTDITSYQFKAGWILLALTVPLFWGRRLFSAFANFFLSLDSLLVAAVTQTERIDNLVAMPNGGGYLQIAAPCSSMANVSLAILCWVIFTQTYSVRWKWRNIGWAGLACISVIAINIARISLIGFFPAYFEILHGPIGQTVVSWADVIVLYFICSYGVRHARAAA